MCDTGLVSRSRTGRDGSGEGLEVTNVEVRVLSSPSTTTVSF